MAATWRSRVSVIEYSVGSTGCGIDELGVPFVAAVAAAYTRVVTNGRAKKTGVRLLAHRSGEFKHCYDRIVVVVVAIAVAGGKYS